MSCSEVIQGQVSAQRHIWVGISPLADPLTCRIVV
jgi:hypothetical protein